MRLTTFTDYSLRLLIYLAAAPEQRATIAEVAGAYGISENHLVKVVHLLGRKGVLTNTRGKGGGIQLARPPAQISIGEVVRATEGADRPVECFGAEPDACAICSLCQLPPILQHAIDAFYEVLDRHTIEDMRLRAPALHAALQAHAAH